MVYINVKYTITSPLSIVANTIPLPVCSLFEFTKMKKGARLNSVASLSQGLNVPVAKPTLMKVQNDICGNSKT